MYLFSLNDVDFPLFNFPKAFDLRNVHFYTQYIITVWVTHHYTTLTRHLDLYLGAVILVWFPVRKYSAELNL